MDSAQAAPVVEAVPGADGAAPMAAARVASTGACPVMDRGPRHKRFTRQSG
jgi:hypothetical protein